MSVLCQLNKVAKSKSQKKFASMCDEIQLLENYSDLLSLMFRLETLELRTRPNKISLLSCLLPVWRTKSVRMSGI